MKCLGFKFWFWTFLYLSISQVFSQSYPTKQYTTREGLIQMQVVSTIEDSRGYIWAGTKGGLSKFDGEHFENFTKADGMLANVAYHLFEDSKGNIWFNYQSRGIACFDGKTFKNYQIKGAKMYGSIVEMDSVIFFQCDNKLYSIIDGKLKNPNFKIPPIESNQLMDVFYHPDLKTIGLKTQKTIYLFDKSRKNFEEIFRSKAEIGGLTIQGGEVYLIENTPVARLIYRWQKAKDLEHIGTLSPSKKELKIPLKQHLILPYASATYLVEKGNTTFEKISNFFFTNYSQQSDKTEKSRLYFGTEKGLFVVFINGFRYFEESEVPYAWSVTEDQDQNIWMANFGYALQKWDGKKVEPYADYEETFLQTFKSKTKHVFDKNYINNWYFHAIKDMHGKLWFPNLISALVRDSAKNKVLVYPDTDGIPKPDFFFLDEDRKRNMIIACGQGQIRLIENTPPYHSNVLKDTAKMFQNDRFILCSMVDHKNDYWFGGENVMQYNPDNKSLRYFDLFDGKDKIRGVGSIIQDTKGNIWAGTFSYGLYLYNPHKQSFERVFKNLIDGPAFFIGEMKPGLLMVGDNKNLYAINTSTPDFLKNPVISTFNHHNGFMGLEPGQAGFFKDSRNRIWITSGSVLSYLELDKLNLTNNPLKTIVRSVNGMKLKFETQDQPISLPKNINQLKLTVESIGLHKSFESEFAYKVGTGEWSEWSKGNTLFISNLSDGVQKVSIKSRRGSLDNGEEIPAEIYVNVNLPFYKSPAFTKYAALISALLISAFFWMLYFNRKQALDIKKQLARIKQQEQKVRLLQLQTNQAQLNPHFTFNVLGTLQNMILSNRSEEANEQLVKLAALIRNFMETSLKMDENSGSLISMEISLREELDLLKKYIEFEQLQFTDRFDYQIIIAQEIDLDEQQIPPLLIQPYVENAIKHGILYKKERGLLIISIEKCEEDCLKVIIKDNGVGIEIAREKQSRMVKAFQSRGMELTEKRIAMLNEMEYNIAVSTQSENHKGTEITITIDYKS